MKLFRYIILFFAICFSIKSSFANALPQKEFSFVENKGQMVDMDNKPIPFVLFSLQTPGANIYITEKGITYLFYEIEQNASAEENKNFTSIDLTKNSGTINWSRVDMELEGARINKSQVVASGKSSWDNRYFYGHCPNGITDVHGFAELTIKNIYPGIDWVLYNSSGKGFKYDFIVHPQASYKDIKMLYLSEEALQLDENGSIKINTEQGNLSDESPISYLKENKTPVNSNFVVKQKNLKNNFHENGYQTSVSFNISAYNPTNTLIIDPQLSWGTFFGGNNADWITNMDTDTEGNLFCTGTSMSINFPTRNNGNFYRGTLASTNFADVVIFKFSKNLELLWSTYYGGNFNDGVASILTDQTNNVFVIGGTASANLPLQNAGTFYQNTLRGNSDGFILKFDNNGNRLWATLYGGSGSEGFYDFDIDSNNNLIFTGATTSLDLSSTNPSCLKNSGTFHKANKGSSLPGDWDGVILKFDNLGNLLWGTYYGGNNRDELISTSSDSNGNFYVTGYTASNDITIQGNGAPYSQTSFGPGPYSGILLKFDSQGTKLLSTYFGGPSGNVYLGNTAIDKSDNLIILGTTRALDLPLINSGGYFQPNIFNSSFNERFISKLDPSDNLIWSTYFGGSGQEPVTGNTTEGKIKVDKCDNIYLYFSTSSTDLQTPGVGVCGNYVKSLNSGSAFASNGGDLYLCRFNKTNTLQWGTYLGGVEHEFPGGITVSKLDGKTLFTGGSYSYYTSNNINNLAIFNPGNEAVFKGTPYQDPQNTWRDIFLNRFSPITPSYNQTVNKTSVCTACDASIIAEINCALPPYSFKWSNGQQTLNTNNNVSIIDNLCPGNYWVEITDGDCNTDTLNFHISAINANVTYSINPTSCNVDDGSIYIEATGNTGPYTFLWQPSNATTSSISNLPAGSYTCTIVESTTSCSEYYIFTIPKIQNNLSLFLSESKNICLGDKTTLTALATGGNGSITYVWTPGDFSSKEISIYPLDTITYRVRVTDSLGCIKDSSVFIQVKERASLFFPSVFTPNNDNLNDIFKPIGADVSFYTFQIYNQWGTEVFSSQSQQQGWDGSFNSQACENGMYIWRAEYDMDPCSEQKLNTQLKTGKVFLLR